MITFSSMFVKKCDHNIRRMVLGVLEYSCLLESHNTVVELMYCMFFERYGDVVVPVLSTVLLLACSSAYSPSTDFDCQLKTANEKFILGVVMVNIFYIHY